VEETRRLLRELSGVDIILVGGQAINIWAMHYLSRVEDLEQEGPFTSKDVDFLGDQAAVRACADRIPECELLIPKAFDQHSPVNTGVVKFIDADGYPRKLDVLGSVLGLNVEDVKQTAVELQTTEVSFNVMHPVLCMKGRVSLVLALGREDEQTFRQMRAAIICAREFLVDLISRGELRNVLNWIEHIFGYALRKDGLNMFRRYKIDVFKAVPRDLRLPKRFLDTRYPQMTGRLAARRQQATPPPPAL
jgi:hypothetical protein